MVTIKNDVLQVELEPKGAEISKIIGLQDGINYMWKQDPCLWAHSAPILFPIVGALKDGQCRINGKTYKMNQHGFSRNTDYAIDEADDNHVVFHMSQSEATKEMYPFDFDVFITYSLDGNKLVADLRVENNGADEEIYFQIGGHPAFACPFVEGEDVNAYYVEFEKPEYKQRKMINDSRAGMSHETQSLFEGERRFFVRQAMFDHNAIVVKDFESEWVAIKSILHNKSLVFHMKNFDHVGLWTSKHVGGLLAIEPWVGHIDWVDFDGEFKEKESIVTLKQGEKFDAQFIVEINQ
ncbi:MAG: aldose 1-epimerase family protein [Erysipelotrichaceae bacterium]|nr:aldose 1-epimerase family protein [Erysipelotrichaceae bacterium]